MVVYLDQDNIQATIKQKELPFEGVSNEWENEGVAHLRATPSRHSFGKETKVLFTGDEISDNIKGDFSFIVQIKDTDKFEIEVYQKSGNQTFEKIKFLIIPTKLELYSRNKGILEVSVLEKKRVTIVGLGSFGSQIAIALAKAGVGEFNLIDFDRVELHNLARHTSNLNELGRLKTDAIEDAVKGKNPYAIVNKYPININDELDLLRQIIHDSDIVICATDNNKSRFNLSRLLVEEKKIGIFGRAVTRAEGGDVFIYRPGKACYCCLIGTGFFNLADEEITNLQSARESGRIASYVPLEEANAMVQVGLAADIEPICNLMVKLALVELSKGTDSGIKCLENELVHDYYMWANRRERRHSQWAAFPNSANRPTILRWYGAYVPKEDHCPVCSKSIVLDEGEEYEELLNNDISLEDVSLD